MCFKKNSVPNSAFIYKININVHARMDTVYTSMKAYLSIRLQAYYSHELLNYAKLTATRAGIKTAMYPQAP
jgi:hypothetical protein